MPPNKDAAVLSPLLLQRSSTPQLQFYPDLVFPVLVSLKRWFSYLARVLALFPAVWIPFVMLYTVFLLVTRKSTVTPEQFKAHWENVHIPLLKSIVGPLFPLHYKRFYFARTERKGFGGPANRDHPPLILRGRAEDFDFDAAAEMMWEDEKTFQEFYKAIYETSAAAQLAEDEELFMEGCNLKFVVVGETVDTTR